MFKSYITAGLPPAGVLRVASTRIRWFSDDGVAPP